MHVITEPQDLAETARRRFRVLHGAEPQWVATAPGRVNLVGEHTDYLGGTCLPIALPYATWAAGAPRTDGLVHVTSGEDLTWRGVSGQVPDGWAAYVVGALLESGQRGGHDVHVESTVPVGAGLSSSAALICAVLRGASRAPSAELVTPTIRAETVHVGAPTGGLDQTVGLLARPDHALLLDFADGTRNHVAWRPGDAGLELLVIDTRVSHAHADGGYRDRRTEGELAWESRGRRHLLHTDPLLVRRRRHVLTENARVRRVVDALSTDDWAAVGEAMGESHASLRDDYEVSCPELDLVVDTALAHGALGARMTGGGFGGSAIALVASSLVPRVVTAITQRFGDLGWTQPSFLRGYASGPATRVG